MPSDTYERKLAEQIAQYREVPDIHALPEIFHYWSNKFLRARINKVLGVDSVTEFYAANLFAVARAPTKPTRFASIGAGDCSVEVEVATELRRRGLSSFRLDCLEVSPYLLERGEQLVRARGLQGTVCPVAVDLNSWSPEEGYYAGVMANHSLHHLVNLEAVFESVRRAISSNGVFVTNDVVGRNGHMRWPEVLQWVNLIWPFLPDEWKFNQQLNRLEETFLNHDCSQEGFEGIRAQDILPLLQERFRFRSFLAYGGLIDVFIDRSFGHNIAPQDPKALAFIDFVQALNDVFIDKGMIKPTMVFAVMALEDTATTCWRNWTPAFCTRLLNL